MLSMVGATQEQRIRLLVVDDDDVTRTMLTDALTDHFDVVESADGPSALAKLARHRFDCVLADHQMPGMTGVELLDAVHERAPSAVRILMTATESGSVFSEAVNRARVHRLLMKPLRWLELPSVVSGAVREAKLAEENEHLLRELAQANERLELQVAQRTHELAEAVKRFERLSLLDSLTELHNHRFIQVALAAEIARAQRYGGELSLLFMDVDHFKHYNDRNGHSAGDRLLKRLGQLLVGGSDSSLPPQNRASDIAARYGGEEFVMVLPQTGAAGASIKAERVRRAIAEHPFEYAAEQPLGCVSVSIGAAVFPAHATNKEELLAAADQELYRAKRLGRNRVCVAGQE